MAYSLMVFGLPGIGKTSLAAHFPECAFIIDNQEQGIRWLAKRKLCPTPSRIEEVSDFAQLDNLCKEASTWKIKTLVLDSLTGFEKLAFLSHCEQFFDNDFSREGFFAYQSGPKSCAKTEWPAFLDTLTNVCRAGIQVILLAHSTIKTYENPTGPNYDKFMAYCDKEIWAQTHRWAQAVLFYSYNIEFLGKDGEAAPVNKKRKPDVEMSRVLYTSPAPAWDAKNQLGLPWLIDAGETPKATYQALKAALKD